MKKIIILLVLFIAISSFSQNRYSQTSTSSFTPLTSSEIMAVPLALQARYDENQKYLYALKKWILDLKTSITFEPFLGRLNGEYEVLSSMEDDDLARATKQLNKRKNSIEEIISEYKLYISKQNSENSSNRNLTENQKSQTSEIENYWKKGIESYQNKDYPTAVQFFSKFLENNPDNTDVLFSRALTKSEIDDIYGAISDYDKILSLEGKTTPKVYKFSTVYNNKAYCLVRLEMYKEALPFVEKALELDKTEWYIWDTRAEILLNLGEFDKCIADCTKAISIKPNGNSYLVRGLAHIKNGEKVKGCQDLSKAGELGEELAYQKIKEYCNKK